MDEDLSVSPTSSSAESTVWPRIVVGVEGVESRPALEWAAEEAVRRRAIVEAVMVWHDPYSGKNWTAPMSATAEPRTIAATRGSQLAGLIDDVGRAHPGARIDAFLRDGRPVPALLQAARGADLLVVGCSPTSKLATALSRSVGQRVASRAPCPVVIVPSPSGEPVGAAADGAGTHVR